LLESLTTLNEYKIIGLKKSFLNLKSMNRIAEGRQSRAFSLRLPGWAGQKSQYICRRNISS